LVSQLNHTKTTSTIYGVTIRVAALIIHARCLKILMIVVGYQKGILLNGTTLSRCTIEFEGKEMLTGISVKDGEL